MKRWPPYELVEEDLAHLANAKMKKAEKLEKLYHRGQETAWDGRQVLADLIAKHGKPRLAPDKRDAALKILSVLLWGEAAAWAISADLAERIDDVEAKMAATSQAHDEARHFYVLRDYLRALGEPIPRLGGLGRRLLVGILETKSLPKKLLGMQLLTESNALAIFRGLVDADVEPVLAELLPYYERDEARHVGLGVMYLPKLVAQLSRTEAFSLAAFQARCVALLISAGMTIRGELSTLGMEPRRLAASTVKLQDQIVSEMRAAHGRVRGVVNPTQGFGPRVLDFVHPPGGEASASPLHRAALGAWRRAAFALDRALM